MKYRNSTRPSTRLAFPLAAALAALLAAPATHAATVTWSGATDTAWSTPTNWVGAVAPVSGDSLVFGVAGASGLTLNNNTAAATSYAGITFNPSASHYTITGNSITLGGNITVGTNAVEILGFNLDLDATRTLSVDTGSALYLDGLVSGSSFGVTKAAAGTLFLNGSNNYSGATTLSAGTLVAATLAAGGSPSSIGQSTSAAANLVLNGGTLRYTGPAISTDRSFTLGGNAALEASGSGALNLANPATPGYGGANAARTLTLSGMNPGDNTLAALLTNNGSGANALTKAGSGTWILSGANTYTGVTTISRVIPNNGGTLVGAGTLVATTLADGGSPSSIGQSTSAATNLVFENGSTLKYIGAGPGHSTNRSFTINGNNNNTIGATLDASGAGAVNFTSTATPAYGTVNFTRTLTLAGTSTATNTLSALLANNGTGLVSLNKAGIGNWSLNGTAVNTNTGSTSVNGGTLTLDFANLGTPTDLINSASALAFGGGTLAVKGKDSSASSQTFGNPTYSANGAGSGISVTGGSGSTADLVLGSTWTRNVGSTVNVTLGTGGTVTSGPAVDASTPTPLVKGSGNIAFATVGGADWAKVSGGTVVAFASGDYTAGLPASGATSTENYSHSGNATVSASESVNTLKLTTTAPGQSLAITDGQTLTLNAGGLLLVGANDYSITGGTVRGSGGTQKDLVIHHYGVGNLTIGSLIADNGGKTNLTKAGPGNLTLTNANTHTGDTSVSGGTLTLKHAEALKSSTLNLNGASLVFDSSVVGNAFTLGGLGTAVATSPGCIGTGYDIALQNNAGSPAPIALTVGGNNANTTFNGSLTGPGDLIKDGNGQLTLSGSNSYTGTTTVKKGILFCGVTQLDSFLGTRPGGPVVIVESGATLQLNQNNITGTITLKGGTLLHTNGNGGSWGGSVVLDATSTFSIRNGTFTLTAIVSGPGGLNKINTNTLVLTRANTYAGPTTVTEGVLKCDNPNSLGSGALSISGTGTVNLNYTGTKRVASLTLGGVLQTTPGTYGSSTSGATFTSTLFTGTGTVTIGTAYDTWASGFLPADVSNKAGNNDGDTLTNLEEFAYGTQPTVSTGEIVYSGGTLTTPGAPKLVAASGTYSMVFGRRADYVAAGLTYTVQFSAGLDTWVDNNDTTNPPVQVATDGTINAMSVPFVDFIMTPSGMRKPTFARVKVQSAP